MLQWGTGMASWAKRANQGKTFPRFLTAKEPCEVTGNPGSDWFEKVDRAEIQF